MFLLLLSSFLVGISTPIASHLIESKDALIFAFQFLLILTLLQIPMILPKWREVIGLFRKKQILPLLITGFIGTFLYWCEFSSLKVGLPIAHISFLSLTVPCWVLLYEYLRGEGSAGHLNKWIMGIVGSVIMILPVATREFSLGHLLPVFTSLFFAAFIISAKRSQEAGISPVVCSFFNDLLPLIGVVILIFMHGQQDEMLVLPGNPVGFFFFTAFIGLLPGLIFLYGLKTTELTTASIIVIIEPIILGVIAVVVSEDALSVNFVIAAIIITVANMPDIFFSTIRKVRVVYAAFGLLK